MVIEPKWAEFSNRMMNINNIDYFQETKAGSIEFYFAGGATIELNIALKEVKEALANNNDVPDYVSEYINNEKSSGYTLYGAFLYAANNQAIYSWLINDHAEDFARRWLNATTD